MDERQPYSRAQAIRAVLAQADQPLTFEELLIGASALFPMNAKSLKKGLNTLANIHSPDGRLIQRTAEGRYGWLPKLVVGASLWHMITLKELKEQLLLVEAEIVTALFPVGIGWGESQTGNCQLSGGKAIAVRVERVGEKDWRPIWGAHLESGFWHWLTSKRAKPGDALLFKIEGGSAAIASLIFEPRSVRNESRVIQPNARVGDAAFEVIKSRRRRVRLDDLAARLLALGTYHDPCPPDSLEVVLDIDARFRWERGGVKEAKRYDHLYRALGLEESDVFDLFEERPKRALRLRPPRTELAHQVYRFWTAFRHNKSPWRRIEIRGDQLLRELDREMRAAFSHDSSDHLSEFYLGVDADAHRRGLGEHNPYERGAGDGWKIGELGLASGDELSYTYDFGDNIQHVLKLEAVISAEPGVKYPRVMEQNKPRYRYCAQCKQEGKKEIATWVCIDCSNEEQRVVLVCEEHAASEHEDHYTDEVRY